ncbi:glycosyltransferase family A protein [Actinopolymorpha sp. B11F2]|uniref:glycosyltransferase family 2 protein n=1 Tax=Actinopolymorpha sp. B11F2 TaxID=3160862 RepID=UPI0032E531CE
MSGDVKVTVVVPVFNARTCLDACLQSVLGQTLAPHAYDVVFVDDGSTDGTSQRLDGLAAEHAHIRVLHLSGSGGPGRPRNVGADNARGEYVYFLDQDDWLAPNALERLHAMAVRCGSDIVIGKVVGHGGRGVPASMFTRSRDRADILADRLLGFLTPHKLFRTAFLREHGLRFPEGPAWLEDHRMVVRAYFLARTISVLADDVCCHWVKLPRRAHHSARHFDPVAYYQALREVLDIVDAHTSPGDDRDRMYASWYHAKMLRLVAGPSLANLPLRWSRYVHHREIRRLADERFAVGVDRFLPVSMRVRSRLLRAGAYGAITRLAAAERGLTIVAALDGLDWDGTDLVVRASARLAYADGRPVTLRRAGGRLLWIPPCRLRTMLPDDAYDVTDVIADSRLDVYVQNRGDRGAYPLPTRSHLVPDGDGAVERIRLRATARLDARTAKLGRPLDAGVWDCFVRAETCGWGPQRRLARPTTWPDRPPAEKRILADDESGPVWTVEPYWTALGNLSLRTSRKPARRGVASREWGAQSPA